MRKAFVLLVSAGLSLGLGIGLSSALPDVENLRSGYLATPVTTDTLEYCSRLSQELAAAEQASDAVRQMAREGMRLCETGQIRGGLLRLRRAMVMVRASR